MTAPRIAYGSYAVTYEVETYSLDEAMHFLQSGLREFDARPGLIFSASIHSAPWGFRVVIVAERGR